MPEQSGPGSFAPERIDSHLHLWELGEGRYTWLNPSLGMLHDSFTAEQAQEALFAAGVSEAILVQADDTAADTEAMLAAADGHPWITGVVGWLPLEQPARAAELLEQWQANPAFCGVRTLIHDDPRPNVLDLPAVRETMALLEAAGLALDIPNAFPRDLGQTERLARDFPQLPIVIDHLGKPPRDGSAEDMDQWERQLRRVAAQPNTVAKLSGLHTGGAEYSAAALARVWDVALSAFGPQRLMFGGDWPVSLLGGSYAETVAVSAGLIGQLETAEAQDVWAGTARRIYRR